MERTASASRRPLQVMGPSRLAFFSRSQALDAEGGGGQRRSRQILETLAALEHCEFRCVGDDDARRAVNASSRGKGGSFAVKVLRGTGGSFRQQSRWPRDFLVRVSRLQAIARAWAKDLKRMNELELAVVEDPVFFEPLVSKLRSFGVPVIASCQNIESLAYPSIPLAQRKILLEMELDVLSRCELVLAISREDTWLLNSFGIPVFFFPYHPPAQVKERLLGVRQARRGVEKSSVMLLGNAGNMATRDGMGRVMGHWREKKLTGEFGRLLLAGFHTDCFAGERGVNPHVEYLGPLSADELYQRLVKVRACLVYQEGGGGALTRIAEMLVAGIPVLASSHAARSYHGVAGVIEFRELQDLEGALERLDLAGSDDLEFPVPAEPDAAALASEIRAILGDRKSRPEHRRRQ